MIAGIVAGGGVGAANSYLDLLATTPQVCYSLSKRISTATVAIRVRRSSDNTEQDIGFSGLSLDTAALASFVGGGNGFVVTFYDQTAGANHFTMATQANQPRIVNAGVFDDGLAFDGTNDGLVTASTVTMGTAVAFVFAEFAQTTSSSQKNILEASTNYASSSNRFALYDNSTQGGLVCVMGATGAFRANSFVNAGAMGLWAYRWDRSLSGTAEIAGWLNGSTSTATAVTGATTNQTGTFGDYNLYLGSRNGGASLRSTAKIRQVVVYNADVDSIRSSIETILGT